jgi:putative flippase GtrA
MAFPAPDLYSRVRTAYSRIQPLLPELMKFCIVGGIGTVIDLGSAALLHGKYHVEPLAAQAISTAAATVFTYLGSRFWTFKHRENQELKREALLFVLLNLAGLLIAEVVVGFVTYVIDMHGQLAYNAASFVGTGLATIFRYYAYKRWVFLAPGEQGAVATAPATPEFLDYPPWDLDPSFLGPHEALPETLAAAPAPAPAPAYSSPWGSAPAAPWASAPAARALDQEPAAAVTPRPSGGRHRRN